MVNSTPDDTRKHRILYVDKNYKKDYESVSGPVTVTTAHFLWTRIVVGLQEKYDVTTMLNLDQRILPYIQEKMQNDRIEALITHVPYNKDNLTKYASASSTEFYFQVYWDSLSILRKVKQEIDPSLFMLVYTGADDSPDIDSIFKTKGCLDAIVHKSNDYTRDLEQIMYYLDEFFQKSIR